MKIIAGLALVWLLCGITAAGVIEETRPATLADVEQGPIALVKVLMG